MNQRHMDHYRTGFQSEILASVSKSEAIKKVIRRSVTVRI